MLLAFGSSCGSLLEGLVRISESGLIDGGGEIQLWNPTLGVRNGSGAGGDSKPPLPDFDKIDAVAGLEPKLSAEDVYKRQSLL